MVTKIDDTAKLAWIELDPSAFRFATFTAYNDYKAAAKRAGELREAFENIAKPGLALQADLRDGEAIVMGYKFGKVSYAIGKDKPAAGASKKARKVEL